MDVLRQPRALGVARRASLILALAAGFWLLALVVLALLLHVPYAQGNYDGAVGFSGFACIAAAVSLLIALRPRFRPRSTDKATPLARERAGRLYAFVEGIGAQAGVKAPVAIYLRPECNASIAAVRHWYGGIRRLDVVLGYGLFCLMDEQEVGAVVAHEYGHFVGGDLGLTPWVYRMRQSMGATLGSLESSLFLLDWPFRWYAQWFLRHTASISRAQEYAADALSAKLFGPEAIRSSLERTDELGAIWSVYVQRVLFPAVNQGGRLPIRAGFERFLASDRRSAPLQAAIAEERVRQPNPYDTHPTLEERVHALTGSAPVRDRAPQNCTDMFGDDGHAESAWYGTFINGNLKAASWDAFGDEVMLPRIRARFANTFLAPDRVPLTALPDLVNDIQHLWEKTKPKGLSLHSPLARRKHVLEILEEFAIASLAHAGYRLDAFPGEDLRMSRDACVVFPDRLLADTSDGKLRAADLERLVRRDEVPEAGVGSQG
ncbi:MAG TPA: M48 family metallopeptidase [Xanthomonadaceae bacterium]|jgi:Zn-dependent protease with chaperone function